MGLEKLFGLIVPGMLIHGAYKGYQKSGVGGAITGGLKESAVQGIAYSAVPAALALGASILGGGAIITTLAVAGGFGLQGKIASLFNSEDGQAAGEQTQGESTKSKDKKLDVKS